MAIPLVFPNNFKWDKTEQCLKKTESPRSSLTINSDALRILRSIRQPVCVIAIVGPSRTGKSYFLSRMVSFISDLEQPYFKMNNKCDPETMGIWMWHSPIEYQMQNGRKVSLILLDTEGIDAYNAAGTTDTQIFTMSVLLSSIIIYNSILVPRRDDLEKMTFIANLAKSIGSRDQNNLSEKETCQIAPGFFWLLRDAHLEPTNMREEQCTFLDYLIEKVLACPGDTGNNTTLNRARKCLLGEFFRFLDADMLPYPTLNKKALANLQDPNYKREINSEFLQKGNDVIQKILQKCSPKRGYDRGSVVNGIQLANLLENYVHSFNSPGMIPDVCNAWEMAAAASYKKAVSSGEDKYRSIMEATITFPMETDHLMTRHTRAKEKAIAEFKEFTCFDSSEEKFSDNLFHLKESLNGTEMEHTGKCTGGILFGYLEENMRKSKDFCNEYTDKLLKEKVFPLFKKITAKTSASSIHDTLRATLEDYDGYAVGPAKHQVKMKLQKELEKEQERNMSYLIELKGNEKQLLHLQSEKEEQIWQANEKRQEERRKTEAMMQKQAESLERFKNIQAQRESQYETMKMENERLRSQVQRILAQTERPDESILTLLRLLDDL